MFIPKHFRNDHVPEIFRFVRDHGFGLLVSSGDPVPFITHVPFELRESEEGAVLHAHLSAANPHARHLSDGQQATAVFQGPHAYVSSRWYNHVNVPTWNYIAVHLSGTIRIFSKEELRQSLDQLMHHYESGSDTPLRMEDLPPEMIEKYLKGIVGFELRIEQVEGKWKLSQNRDAESYENIIRQLKQLADPDASRIADEMMKLDRKEISRPD